jgi:superfamily II DNA or RNA helicase
VARTIRLRPWQKRALEEFHTTPPPDFLAVATPGAGKTTFALAAAIQDLAGNPRRRVVVVAPTQHLKHQWAGAAASLDLHLEPEWTARDGELPADMHGVVVTYQQVASSAPTLRALARGAFVVLDEIHHAGEDRAWGDGLRLAFEHAARRLSLSGTPFRSDTTPIPFVRYAAEEAYPHFSYAYGEALAEGGVVRPVFFPRVDGEMEWVAPDGVHHAHTFGDRLDRVRAGQRLRTALSLDGDWLPAVLERAHGQLRDLRREQPDTGGLVVTMDQEHARGVAAIMRARLGVEPEVATSEDPDASARIARYAASQDEWLVAVRMVSEGVDIPRLRVGVFATNTTTELFFRQAVGRLVRWQGGRRRQRAHLYIPDDDRLRTFAAQIAETRRHVLRRREREDVERAGRPQAGHVGDAEQLSLFQAISAVALDERDGVGDPHGWDEGEPDLADATLELALAPPPLLGAGTAVDGARGRTRQQEKAALRARNADRARHLVSVTGWSHAQVNAELNRLAGIRRVSEATVGELRERADAADRWLRRL